MILRIFMTGLLKVVIISIYKNMEQKIQQLIELIIMEIMNHQIVDGQLKKNNQIIGEKNNFPIWVSIQAIKEIVCKTIIVGLTPASPSKYY